MATTRQPKVKPSGGGAETRALPEPAFHDPKHHVTIYQGDCLELLPLLPEGSVDVVFADPYRLLR